MFLTQQRQKTWNFGPKCLEKAVQIVPELQTCRGTRDIHPSQLLLRRSKKFSHDCWDAPQQDSDDIIGDDAKFLEIIGCLRGSNCCCRRLLFSQSDFVNQKSQLEELITLRGHICDFYPKYHCD